MSSHSLLQGIFSTQGLNQVLLHYRQTFYHLRYKESPQKTLFKILCLLKFLHSSAVKESTCNAGDPSSMPGSGRSAGEGIGYPLQYSWASLVARLVKTLPARWENWVQSLVWEDPLEKGMATHSSILAWRIPWIERGALWAMGCKELDTPEQLSLHFT